MGLREDAIAEILACQIDLQQAKANLEPIEQVTGVVNAPLAYQNIIDSITLCGQAVTVLQDAPGNPVIDVAPGSFSFTFPGAVQNMGVRNSGTGTLQGTISTRMTGGGSPPNWLTVQPLIFTSTGLPDVSSHTVTINWSLIAAGALVTAEIVLDSNGGQAIRSVSAQNGTAQGGPVLDLTTNSVSLDYPEGEDYFSILNAGNQAQALSWSVVSQNPEWLEAYYVEVGGAHSTSGTTTTEQDQITCNPLWSSFASNEERQTIVTVNGTYQGDPVQGSPQLVNIIARRGATTPPPPPPPPPPGGGNCNYGFQALGGAWTGWCGDDVNNFPSNGSEMGMESNQDARRNVLLGGLELPQGTPPPTVGSNRVIMECDIKFAPDYLIHKSGGGQHLFQFGRSPFTNQSTGTNDAIRLDWGAPLRENGIHFADGVSGLVYLYRGGQRIGEFTWNTLATGVWNQANTWFHFKAEGLINTTQGTATMTITYHNGQVRTATVTRSELQGHPFRIGDSISWGNVDNRSGLIWLRNLSYRTS